MQEQSIVTMPLRELASSLTHSSVRSLNGLTGTVVAAKKHQAAEYFLANGFPTIRNEEWKYTNVMPLAKTAFQHAVPALELPASLLQTIEDMSEGSARMVFVNGQPFESLPSALPNNTQLVTLQQALHHNSSSFAQMFGSVMPPAFDAFVALNTATASEGIALSVPNMAECTPLTIFHIADGRSESPFSQLRHLISLGAYAKADVRFVYLSLGEVPSFTNIGTEILLGEGAKLSITTLQGEDAGTFHVNSSFGKQEAHSTLSFLTLSYGKGFTRNTTHAVLNKEQAHTDMLGLVAIGGKAFVDNHTLIDHAAPNCTSSENYKHVLGGQSTAVFNGKIMVRQEAQKTNAYQSNKTLLLTERATINTKPQLEIFADDVKCSHGATSGQLDEEALFYLQARGIPKAEARLMLTIAFADEILNAIAEEHLRQPVSDAVHHFLSETVPHP